MAVPGGFWAGDTVHGNNDFEQGSYDAQIAFTDSGPRYAVYVNTYGAGEMGRYARRAGEVGSSPRSRGPRSNA